MLRQRLIYWSALAALFVGFVVFMHHFFPNPSGRDGAIFILGGVYVTIIFVLQWVLDDPSP